MTLKQTSGDALTSETWPILLPGVEIVPSPHCIDLSVGWNDALSSFLQGGGRNRCGKALDVGSVHENPRLLPWRGHPITITYVKLARCRDVQVNTYPQQAVAHNVASLHHLAPFEKLRIHTITQYGSTVYIGIAMGGPAL